jgi:hypothetical protein
LACGDSASLLQIQRDRRLVLKETAHRKEVMKESNVVRVCRSKQGDCIGDSIATL